MDHPSAVQKGGEGKKETFSVKVSRLRKIGTSGTTPENQSFGRLENLQNF